MKKTVDQGVELSDKLVIMYHSVGGNNMPAVTGSFPISFDRFKYQIELLFELGYQCGRLSELHSVNSSGAKFFYITGDDGTKDWSKNVLPWCEEFRLYTHTGVIVGPWLENAVYPLAHVVQVVLAIRSEKELKKLAKRLAEGLSSNELDYVSKVYAYELSEERRIIKGVCNLILDEEDAFESIGDLNYDELESLRHRFEVSSYYKKYKYAEVGNHTVTHSALGLDVMEYFQQEIDYCDRILLNNGIKRSDYFTMPMKPKFGANVDNLIEPLKERGYKGVLTSYPGIWDGKSYVVERIDANQLERSLNSRFYSG